MFSDLPNIWWHIAVFFSIQVKVWKNMALWNFNMWVNRRILKAGISRKRLIVERKGRIWDFWFLIDFFFIFRACVRVLTFTNCAVNMFIYTGQHSEFRAAMKSLFCCCGPKFGSSESQSTSLYSITQSSRVTMWFFTRTQIKKSW